MNCKYGGEEGEEDVRHEGYLRVDGLEGGGQTM